jgi:hypothetical protein
MNLLRGAFFFVFALVLWEFVALFVMSRSLGAFLKSLGDPLLLMAMFFNGLYALPIALYIAIVYSISRLLDGRTSLPAFVGMCCVGSLGLIAFFMNSPNVAQLREQGFVAFLVFPTLCVFTLYLGRSILQRPNQH